MSGDPEFEKRINNKLETIVETQANLQEAIAGLIQVARLHDGQLDDHRQQIGEIWQAIGALAERDREQQERIKALAEQGREQQERINALIRIVEGHLTNHP